MSFKWGQMFQLKHTNITNLVEHMWQYVKYTLSYEKMNCRLNNLILAMFGNPKRSQQLEGNTLVDLYNKAHLLSEFGKYI